MQRRIDLLKQASGFLSKEGFANASGEAELALSHILQCPRLDLYLDNLPVKDKESGYFWQLVNTRAKGIPLQYLLGSVEFMGWEFKVSPGVFIPRPETEILVETSINILNDKISQLASCPVSQLTGKPANRQTGKLNILDIGTGCGNIAISIAKEIKEAHIFACDISDYALQLARDNSNLNRVEIALVKSNLFSAFKKESLFSLIISNPPYICVQQIDSLSREVHYEPQEAYNGGRDGLSYYQRIIQQAPNYLEAQGLLALEIGDNQAGAVKQILEQNARFSLLSVEKDYNNIERVILAQLRNKIDG